MKQKFAKLGWVAAAVCSLGFSAAASLPSAQAEADDGGSVKIYASVVTPSDGVGLYSFDAGSYSPTLVKSGINASSGGFEAKGYYYNNYYDSSEDKYRTQNYSTEDWTIDYNYSGYQQYMATTISYSYERDEAYGCFYNADGSAYNFVRWNYSSFYPKKVICGLNEPWAASAFDPEGTLYAIEQDGDLYTVTTKDGSMTLVGNLGVTSTGKGDAAFDHATGKMYWSVSSDKEKALYEVDVKTVTATKLYDFTKGEELCGMYIPYTPYKAVEGCPEPCSELRLNFGTNSMSGQVHFKTPYYVYLGGGDPLDSSVDLDYTVYANGKVIATGKSKPNTVNDVDISFTEADNYYITVTTTNSVGESNAVGSTKFIGQDSPASPTSFTVTAKDGKVNFSWYAPSSTGLNDGTISGFTYTYTLTRYPDMKVIAEDITARTAVDDALPTPDEPTAYYYVLTTKATNGDVVVYAPDVRSQLINLGPIEAPFTTQFAQATDVLGWTILDINGDGYKWSQYSSYYGSYMECEGYRGHDDWLITPVMNVKGNATYPIELIVSGNDYYEEEFKVYWGLSPEVDAMTNLITSGKTVKDEYQNTTLTGDIKTPEDATKIYIGVHSCTLNESQSVYLRKFTIGEGVVAAAPEAVNEFSAVSAADGSKSVELTFTLPTVNNGGSALTGDNAITKVEIFRDKTSIKTYEEGINAGETITYTDATEDMAFGDHTYSVVVSNKYGDSETADVTVFVGIHKPAAPAAVKFVEDGETGKVTISWEAVTTDEVGNDLASETITYRVIDRQSNTIADKLTATSFEYQAVEAGKQAFVQFGVYAVNEGGESKMGATDYKPAGKALDSPWSESFAEGQAHSQFGYNWVQETDPWEFTDCFDELGTPIYSQDDDEGFALFDTAYGGRTSLVFPKITLTSLEKPAFSFYTYNYSSSSMPTPKNVLGIQVDNGDGNGFVPFKSIRVSETGQKNAWNKVNISLEDFAGKAITIRVVCEEPDFRLYTLDNMRISNDYAKDLAVVKVMGPDNVDINKPFEVDVTVENIGSDDADGYTVTLLKGDEELETSNSYSLAASTSKVHTFEVTLTPDDDEYVDLYAVVNYSADQSTTNNTSEAYTVGTVAPLVPVVTDLQGTSDGNAVTLSWSEPDLTNVAPASVTEDFENAGSWGSVVEGWKFVDQDKKPVSGPQISNFPVTGLQSWVVVDHSSNAIPDNLKAAWVANSGEKYIASFMCYSDYTNYQSDDWAITPRLYGGTQALQFYAKSFDGEYLETFEVLASSGTTNVDDFEHIATVKDVPAAWTKYRFKLPEGTKYAAIRSRSYDRYILFVDDIMYVPADGEADVLKISGYNIYRDGVKLNASVVKDTNYVDANGVNNTDHKYYVTAVYDKGESRSSNTVTVGTSGIFDVIGANVTISAAQGSIVVKGLTEGVTTVYSIEGRVVAQADAAPYIRISLNPGIYVVAAGTTVAKVVVK